ARMRHHLALDLLAVVVPDRVDPHRGDLTAPDLPAAYALESHLSDLLTQDRAAGERSTEEQLVLLHCPSHGGHRQARRSVALDLRRGRSDLVRARQRRPLA